MSQENVEIVRDVYAAFRRRENAAPFAVYAPDIEVDIREGGGRDVQAAYHALPLGALDPARWEDREFAQLLRPCEALKAVGLEEQAGSENLDLVRSILVYFDPDRALADLGLEE